MKAIFFDRERKAIDQTYVLLMKIFIVLDQFVSEALLGERVGCQNGMRFILSILYSTYWDISRYTNKKVLNISIKNSFTRRKIQNLLHV